VQHVQGNRAYQGEEMTAEQTGLSRTQLSRLIDEWIFSERDRSVLKARLLDGMTYDALSDYFDMSVRQIKRIVYKGEDRIFKHL